MQEQQHYFQVLLSSNYDRIYVSKFLVYDCPIPQHSNALHINFTSFTRILDFIYISFTLYILLYILISFVNVPYFFSHFVQISPNLGTLYEKGAGIIVLLISSMNLQAKLQLLSKSIYIVHIYYLCYIVQICDTPLMNLTNSL